MKSVNGGVKPLKIGNVSLKNNLILAPMAGYTDAAFRQICAEAGVGLTVTEMVSAMGLTQGNKNTVKLLMTSCSEQVKAVQLFGHDPLVFANAVKNPALDPFDIIDVNMGCPVKKVIRAGDGCALMSNPSLAADIVKAIKDNSDKPVTVKMRLGLNHPDLAGELIEKVSRAGADAVMVHGRTATQMYAGFSDTKQLMQLAQISDILFFGNGDITSFEDAEYLLNFCDGIGIGRGAVGNPYLIAELSSTPFDLGLAETMIYHVELLDKYYGNKYACSVFRKFVTHYLARLPDMKELKLRIYTCKSVSEIVSAISDRRDDIDVNLIGS